MYAERERERRPPESRASGASLRYEGHRSAASPPSLRRSNRIRSVGPRFRSCVYRHDRCHRDRQALLALLEPCMLEYSLLLRSEVRSSVQYTVDQLLLAGLCSGARGMRGSGIEINPDRIGNAIAKEKRGPTWSREARQRGTREVGEVEFTMGKCKGEDDNRAAHGRAGGRTRRKKRRRIKEEGVGQHLTHGLGLVRMITVYERRRTMEHGRTSHERRKGSVYAWRDRASSPILSGQGIERRETQGRARPNL